MEITLTISQLITFASIINALIFCILILKKRSNKKANLFLTLLILSILITQVTILLISFGPFSKYPWLFYFPFTLSYWIGPSLYFYIKMLTKKQFVFKPKDLWHFSPIVFNYFHSFYHLIVGENEHSAIIHNFTEAIIYYALVSIIIYLFLSYRDLKHYYKRLLNHYSTIDKVHLKWIKQIIIFTIILIVFSILLFLIDFEILFDYNKQHSESLLFAYRDIMLLISSIVLYWLSIGGFKQVEITDLKKINVTNKQDHLNDHSIIKRINEGMINNQLFLDPNLDLKMLSELIVYSEKQISNALNHQLNKNFYTFVNEYRIKEVKKRLIDPEMTHFTILSIAYDSGFNSKSTFNRIFKEQTGRTPNQFKKDGIND